LGWAKQVADLVLEQLVQRIKQNIGVQAMRHGPLLKGFVLSTHAANTAEIETGEHPGGASGWLRKMSIKTISLVILDIDPSYS